MSRRTKFKVIRRTTARKILDFEKFMEILRGVKVSKNKDVAVMCQKNMLELLRFYVILRFR